MIPVRARLALLTVLLTAAASAPTAAGLPGPAAIQQRDAGDDVDAGATAQTPVSTPAGDSADGLTGQALDEAVRRVSSELRCVVCQGVSIRDSPSELARQMKAVVREQLAAGRSPEEVKQYFVDKYGEWILLAPEPEGFNLAVYLLPVFAMLGGAGVVLVAVRRWTGAGTADEARSADRSAARSPERSEAGAPDRSKAGAPERSEAGAPDRSEPRPTEGPARPVDGITKGSV